MNGCTHLATEKMYICQSLIPWDMKLFGGCGCTASAAVLLQNISPPALLTLLLPFYKSMNALSSNIREENRKSAH